LEIGDDVTLSQDAHLGLVVFEQGQVVVAPVTIGAGATWTSAPASAQAPGWAGLLAGAAVVPPAGQSIPDSEMWTGCRRGWSAGTATARARTCGQVLSPLLHAIAMMACRTVLGWVAGVPAR